MSAPTPTRRDVAADLRLANGALLQACIHLGDAILGAQTLGLDVEEAICTVRGGLLGTAEWLDDASDALEPAEPQRHAPKLRLVADDDPLAGMCSQCGRIGDHSTSCPEVA